MTLYDEQIEREKQSVTRGIARLREQLEQDEAAGRTFDNAVGQAQARRLVDRSIENIAKLHKETKTKVRSALKTGTRLSGWEMPLLSLTVDELAFIAVRTMCNSIGRGHREQHVANTIGDVCNLQVRWAQLRKGEKARMRAEDADPGYNRLSYLKREVKAISPKSLRKWLKKMSDIETEEWDLRTRVSLGLELIQAIVEVTPDIFEREIISSRRGRAFHKESHLKFTDLAQDHLERRLRGMGTNQPWLTPMICQPKPWTQDELGGYLVIPRELVKSVYTQSYEDEVPQIVLDAVNAMQDTRWRVNPRVLEVARQAVERGIEEILPVNPVRDVPPEVEADVWESLTNEEKGAVKAERRAIHNNNFRLESKRLVIQRQLEIADDLGDREFYFPHNLDFRGRAYPLPQDLHPQCDDFGKALLTFAEPKKLGASGLKWLCYHVANTAGLDKMTRDEQIAWIGGNLQPLAEVARDPLGAGLGMMAEAEEPWQFLAACIELDNAFGHAGGPEDYECSLPVHVDGSCNGLQHLSAMGRDAVGAQAVNLTPGPRQDIYQIVADKVAEKVMHDAHFELDETALAWYGKVTRKVVKRGVMTKPYGLTHVGMRDQLIADRNKCWPTVEGDIREAATYMRDRMAAAIEDTVHASVAIMDWMQECAHLLAENGLGISWTTPTGFRVTQYYPNMGSRVYTVVGVGMKSHSRGMRINEPRPGLRVTKQVQAIAPNIVHSFDAAHMQMVIAQAASEGLTDSISAVHDSFGVHACDMDRFLGIIKQTFIDLYSVPVLEELYHEFVAQVPEGPEMPRPPALGDFDISEVAKSDFFFA